MDSIVSLKFIFHRLKKCEHIAANILALLFFPESLFHNSGKQCRTQLNHVVFLSVFLRMCKAQATLGHRYLSIHDLA
jgi:hypothetical protein